MASTTRVYVLMCLILLVGLTETAPDDGMGQQTTRVLGELGASDSAVVNEHSKPLGAGMETPHGNPSPQTTDCTENELGFVWCNATVMKEVPQDLNSTIKGIGFYLTGISELPDGVFENYTKLETIILSMNIVLKDVDEGAFRGLPNLASMSLLKSRIKLFKNKTFDGLNNLKSLTIEDELLSEGDEPLTKLPTDLLRSAPKLEHLSVVGFETFKQLNGEALQHVPNLKELYLYSNAITQLEPSVFEHVPNLEVLNLYGNAITHLEPSVFQHVPNLKELYLYGNAITRLEPSVFEHVPNLQKLNLNNNRPLYYVAPSALIGLQYLEEVSVGGNSLTSLDGAAFLDKPKLRKLEISYTSFHCDCNATWMAQAIVDEKVWALEWVEVVEPNKTTAPHCLDISSNQFIYITKLFPQDLTCDRPDIEAKSPTYVERAPETRVSLKALVTKGYPASTWVFPDGTEHKAHRVTGDLSPFDMYRPTDTVSPTDHSVAALWNVSSSYKGTGLNNFTLIATTLAGQSANLTFTVHTPASGAAGAAVYTGTLLLMLISTTVITA